MAANNYNWVCFSCRTAIRKPKDLHALPKCLACARECFCLGYKVEVPKKADVRGWRRLQLACRQRVNADRDAAAVDRVQSAHAVEQQILKLQLLGPGSGRAKQKRRLKRLL